MFRCSGDRAVHLRHLLLAMAFTLLACDAPRQVWEAATRNSRYRAALEAGIDDVETRIGELEEERRKLTTGPPEHRAAGVLAALTHVRMRHSSAMYPEDAITEETSVLRDHLRELKRERAELAGDITARRRRCPIHGDWMFREVVATESSGVPGMTPIEGRLEAWKFPHRGRAAPYSSTQLLPYSRPWVCYGCQEAAVYWKPRLARHLGGNAWPVDGDHILLEAVTAVEERRTQCRAVLEYDAIEPPFHLAATFTAQPDGTLSVPTFVGSEHALDTELTRCLTRVFEMARMRQRPSEPVEVLRLPMWVAL